MRLSRIVATCVACVTVTSAPGARPMTDAPREIAGAIVRDSLAHDRSPRLDSLTARHVWSADDTEVSSPQAPQPQGRPAAAPGSAAGAAVEQTTMGTGPAPSLVTQFEGLGVGFDGPHGTSTGRNPSDNSLAVGPRHVMASVNTRMAVWDKQGHVLWGAVPNNTVFAGFTGTCEARNNGDTVVRYDQLANRWLIVMPIFRRSEARPDQPAVPSASDRAVVSTPGVTGQPGRATRMAAPVAPTAPAAPPTPAGAPTPPTPSSGPYSMCYAVSVTDDPLGEYYRYEFLRPLFPDYPRPAVWPDGYYVPTSTGDEV
ncbi:MAG: hypothetical protein O2917_07715, partial [Acidobacteria bacterium]|nr:hypothetical protein [Acidobacteriota bacterium]